MTRTLIAALLLAAAGPLYAGPAASGPAASGPAASGPPASGPRVDSPPTSGPQAFSPFSATLPPAGAGAGASTTVLPAWMAGTWAMERGADWADALWMGPRGDAMLGIARSGFGPDVQAWELLRIARRGGSLVLLIQPKGGAVIEFPLAVASAEAIEFANAAYDFPQRIRYARAGQLLTIEQSKLDGSEAVRTNYRPVQTGAE